MAYTPLGDRIAALCGTQDQIAEALKCDRSAISRKLHGGRKLTVDDLMKIAKHFGHPMWKFFDHPNVDGKVLDGCCGMFFRHPIALDWILEAFRKDHKNLKKLGEIAKQLCEEG